MLPPSAVVVSDAHLGAAPGEVRDAFHQFVATVPELGEHLVINGDLFDFWFEYRSVIPRSAFATLAALVTLRRAGVRITVTGGNHDRWGSDFWERELDASFHRGAVELDLAGRRALVAHGDTLVRQRPTRLFHAMVRNPITEAVFRWIHPDIGIRMVQKMSRRISNDHTDSLKARSALAQGEYARALLKERSELELVVLGHTHRPVLEQIEEDRWYVNPGAWMDGLRYAVIGSEGPELRVFKGG